MDKRLYVELPPFTGRNVPITEIAKAIGKDAHYVRIGIESEIYPLHKPTVYTLCISLCEAYARYGNQFVNRCLCTYSQ